VDFRPLGEISGKTYALTKNTTARFIAPTSRSLIVDDNATNLKVAEGLLAPYKSRIVACLSGIEAVRLARENRYDIIFMDHMMPEMDGVEATAAIRAIDGEYFQAVPIVALTANALVGMKEMFLRNGFSDYLAKPIEIIKLNEIMEKWIPREKWKKAEPAAESVAVQQAVQLEIEGVDTARGVAMTGGSIANYIEVLSLFREDAGTRLEELGEIPDKAGLPLFVTRVHALKSASASIGATAFSAEAAELEAAGRHGDIIFIRERADGFLKNLSSLVERIHAALPADDQAGADFDEIDFNETDLSLDMTALARLRTALESDNIEEIDTALDSFRRDYADEFTRESLSRVADHVLMADFKGAIDVIDALAKGLSGVRDNEQ
jgi:CheY-like chemotaxis protein